MNRDYRLTKTLVSVIALVRNVERYPPQCVDSVLAQDYDDLDVILLDDGSTDGRPALCDLCASQHPKVRAAHVANGGLITAVIAMAAVTSTS